MIEPNVSNAKVRHVSWGPIFAGTFVALAVELLLALLGLAIGLWNVNPAQAGASLQGIGIGEAIWWLIISIIALFIGGWFSGRLSTLPTLDATMHGIVTWGLVTLVSVYLLTTGIGAALGGAFNVLQKGLGAGGNVAQSLGLNNQLQNQIQQFTSPGGQQLTAQQQQQLAQAVMKIIAPNGDTPENRQNAANLLAQDTNMDPAQARQTVDQWVTGYENALKAAGQAAEVAAKVAAAAAIWAFIMLLLSGVAAAIGAALGASYHNV